MAYQSSSSHYGLPIPRLGDILDPTEERKFAKIVDSQIFGAILTHSSGHGVLTEGEYLGEFATNNSIVSLHPGADGISFEGYINQIYVSTNKILDWTGLIDNTVHYLFVRLIETSTLSSRQNGDVVTYSNTTGEVPVDGLLVTIATTTISGINLDIQPTAKRFIYTVEEHASINNNPHGRRLYQHEITSSGVSSDNIFTRNLIVQNAQFSGNVLFQARAYVTGDIYCSQNIFSSGAVFSSQGMETPGSVEACGVLTSGLEVISGSRFHDNLLLDSGVTVDGIDPSELTFLIDGSDADFDPMRGTGHRHNGLILDSGTTYRGIYLSPEYANTIVSGNDVVSLSTSFDDVDARTLYTYTQNSSATPVTAGVITRQIIPSDFVSWSGINITHRILDEMSISPSTEVGLGFEMYDSLGSPVTVTPSSVLAGSINYETTLITVSGGTFTPGDYFSFIAMFQGNSITIPNRGDLSDLVLIYSRV